MNMITRSLLDFYPVKKNCSRCKYYEKTAATITNQREHCNHCEFYSEWELNLGLISWSAKDQWHRYIERLKAEIQDNR